MKPNIMVFDSNDSIRALMVDLLTSERYRVTVSPFLSESFNQIASRLPALVIIDLGFEEQVGWELLEQLAQDAYTRAIPVLVTSTNQPLLDRAEAAHVRTGGRGWLVKPFNIALIMGEISRLISATLDDHPSMDRWGDASGS